MGIDLSLLRILKHRDDFYRLRGRIPDAAVDAQTKAILDDYGKYFKKFPDDTSINMEVFLPLFRAWHSSLKDDKKTAYEAVLSNASKDVPDHVRQEVMRTLLELRLVTTLANVLTQYDAGDLESVYSEIDRSITEFRADAGIKDALFIDTDIHDLLDEADDVNGIQWRLSCLNDSMRPLQGGDWGIIAGRPDKGKTTLIASELTYMAPQLPPERNVLWLNNEGPGKRIVPRLYQAALGCTRTKLLELKERGLLKPAYKKLMGRLDKIRVVDIHNMDHYSVEQIIEANNAGIVVFDMLDNVRGFGESARTDLGLEKMYQWGRELMVKLDAIGLATSQISAEGNNLQFPGMSMLKDSKTGKQGANDFQIMIGAVDDPGYAGVRWIGIPKNKLRKDGAAGDPRAAVKFDAPRARYEDMPMMGETNDTND